MTTPRREFGWRELFDPRVTAQLDHWVAEDEAEKRIREQNDEIYVRAVASWFRKTDEAQR